MLDVAFSNSFQLQQKTRQEMKQASTKTNAQSLNNSLSSFETQPHLVSDDSKPRLIRHLSTGSDLYLSSGYDYVMKVILLGDQGVGKSSFMKALHVHPEVTKVKCGCRVTPTSDHLEMEVATGQGKTAFIRLYDTGGQERYRSLTSSYYRGAHGVLLIFDVTNRKSLDNVESWISDLDTFSSASSCVRFILGSKCFSKTREVTQQIARKYAEAHSMPYIEFDTSQSHNVVESLRSLVDRIALEVTISPRSSVVITPNLKAREGAFSVRTEFATCLC